MWTLIGNNISDIATNLNKANGILSKSRHHIEWKTVKSIYNAIFEPDLYYPSLDSGEKSNSIKRLFVLQKKSLRVVCFLNHTAHTSPSFRELNILKLLDKVALEKISTNVYPQSLKLVYFLIWFSYLQYWLVQFRLRCCTFPYY